MQKLVQYSEFAHNIQMKQTTGEHFAYKYLRITGCNIYIFKKKIVNKVN